MLAPLFTAEDYLAAYLALLPTGKVWPRDSSSLQVQALLGLNTCYERTGTRASQLLTEVFPGTTTELLGEWEETLGLPDECSGPAPTTDERRALVIARLIGSGGQSISYYVQVALALGYTVTVTSFRAHTVESSVEYPLYGEDWDHTWQVNATGSPSDVLECAISLVKPAHTYVLFVYS